MAEADVLVPAEIALPTCPRCKTQALMTPLGTLTYRCSRCEWPFTFAGSAVITDALPATGVAYTNGSGSPQTVTLSGGAAVTAVSVSGTAQGLAAPAAPAVAVTTDTDGELTAGVYKAVVTYVNAAGETQASASGQATVADGKHLTVPSPPAVSGATGWNAYVTQHGGSTYTLQNVSPTAIGTDLSFAASDPTNTGGAPPATNTTFGTMVVPAGGTITVTYTSTAPTWTWALPAISADAAAQAKTLAFTAPAGSGFTGGQVLIIDPSGTPDIVTVTGTPTATAVPVTNLLSAHSSGVSVTVAQLTPELSGEQAIPATTY